MSNYIYEQSRIKKISYKTWCSFTSGKVVHLLVKRGSKKTVLPMHGAWKELRIGLVQNAA